MCELVRIVDGGESEKERKKFEGSADGFLERGGGIRGDGCKRGSDVLPPRRWSVFWMRGMVTGGVQGCARSELV